MAELPRQLGVATATGIVVANIIGTGIFTTTGFLLLDLRSPALVLLCWAVGGLVALAGALCYAEMATMMPVSGGEYAYLYELYGPMLAFLTGWISLFVGFSAPIAATGIAIRFYLEAAGAIPADAWQGTAIALGIVMVFTAIHYTGLAVGALVQNVLTGLKLLLFAGLLTAGFLFGKGDAGLLSGSDFWGQGDWSQTGVALLWIMFSYSGWNAAAYVGEEIEDPGRNLPRALFLGTLTVVVLYLLFNLLLFYAAPASDLQGVEAVGEAAVSRLFGGESGDWFAWLVALALLSSLSAYILVGPRVYYAMARDRLFFRFAASVHPRWQSPSRSIALQGLIACALILTASFGSLITYIGFALGLTPALVVAGLFLLRWRDPGRHRPYRVHGYPWVPAFFLLSWAWILTVSVFNRPLESFAAMATVLAGVPIYWFTVRRRATSRGREMGHQVE